MPAAKSITRSCRAYPIPEIGQTFGRWTIVAPADPAKTGHRRWFCRCSCGTEKIVPERNFRPCSTRKNPMSLSCGCWRSDRATDVSTTHGHTSGGERTTEFVIWMGIIARCTRATDPGWKKYGAKGITICDAWRHDFSRFLADMGPRPSPDHQIDRYPDNKGNYEKSNCRWATRSENQNNRECNFRIEHDGRNLTVAEWSQVTGLKWTTIKERIKRGWTAKAALTTPVDTRCRSKPE